jgi:hypothetical protein
VLRSASFWTRASREVKLRHRWLGIYHHYAKDAPRAARIGVLAASVNAVLFFQSLTYSLVAPREDVCDALADAAACAAEQSPFRSGQSACLWTADLSVQGGGYCEYVQPGADFRVLVFVVLFCALLSVPVSWLCSWIILELLVPPVAAEKAEKGEEKGEGGKEEDTAGGAQLSLKPKGGGVSGKVPLRRGSIVPVISR